VNRSHRNAPRPRSRERLIAVKDAPRTPEDAVDLVKLEFDATIIAGYDERHRALRRDAPSRKLQS
jgi:hypothetical protein